VTLRHGDRSRFLVIPRTPSDWRAPKNAIAQLRKTMAELGAKRVGEPVSAAAAARQSKGGAGVTVSLTDKIFVVHIAAKSKLIRRFATPDGKRAVAHWKIELRPSVDLTAPPLVVMRQVEASKSWGIVGGFGVKGGSWRITVSRSNIPALARIPNFKGTGVRLYEDNGSELVFELPAGTIPTGFRKPDQAPVETPIETLESPVTKPVSPPPADAPVPVDIGDRPLVLQMPKQGVSIEAAIAVLNKAKRRLGSNLRFTIEEGGYLTAVHKIGS